MSKEYILRGPERHEQLTKESFGKQIYDTIKRLKELPSAMVDAITNEQVSYETLLYKSCELAESLRNYGILQNDVIAIYSENRLEYFYPVLAALYLGATVTTFNPTYTPRELLHVCNISKPKIIFCSKFTLKTALQVKSQMGYIKNIITLDPKEAISKEYSENVETFIKTESRQDFDLNSFKLHNPDVQKDIAFILYSSGTTGLPKGVMLTNNNVNAVLSLRHDPRYSFEVEPGTTAMIAFLPFFHAYGLWAAMSSFLIGRTMVIMKKFEEDVFLKAIEDYKISILPLVPPIANILARSPLLDKYDLSSILYIGCGAAPLSKETEELLRKRLPNLTIFRNSYGMTELTLGVVGFALGEYKPGSCGRPLPEVSLKFVNPDTGKTLGPGLPGEIWVKGPHVMKGYANDPKSTADMIKGGWLTTGDIGYCDEEGCIFIVDRLKELIKYKGYQVAPAELEALLLSHPKILDVGVVGKPDYKAGELPLAFVVIRPNEKLTEEEVKKFVSDQLSPQKWLRGGVKFINEIPKNPSGKILRKELRKLLKLPQSKL